MRYLTSHSILYSHVLRDQKTGYAAAASAASFLLATSVLKHCTVMIPFKRAWVAVVKSSRRSDVRIIVV